MPLKSSIAVFVLVAGCGSLEDSLKKPTAPEEEIEVKELPPEEARQELADLGIQYNQASFIEHAQKGDLEVVRLFVWAGMDVNVQPYTARTVLVPTRDNPTRLDHLESSWFPQDQEDDDTALMKSAGNGHLGVVRFLMDNGADAKIKNRQGQHALMFAAAGGHLDIVKYIVSPSGGGIIRLDKINPMGYDPLTHGPITSIMWAAYGGHLDVVRYLYEDKEVSGYSGYTFRWLALFWAIIGNHMDVMNYILETDHHLNGSNRRNRFDLSAGGEGLMLAAYLGHNDILSRLLDLGADIHWRTSRWIGLETDLGTLYFEEIGFGPLHAAIQAGSKESLRILLNHWMSKHGADGRDEYGMTALMFAAAGGDLEISRTLINNGAPVNGQSDIGMTALMFASEWGHADIVSMLLEEGADASLVSAYGDTALSLAEESGHVDIADLLQ